MRRMTEKDLRCLPTPWISTPNRSTPQMAKYRGRPPTWGATHLGRTRLKPIRRPKPRSLASTKTIELPRAHPGRPPAGRTFAGHRSMHHPRQRRSGRAL
ncbi:hypothetical protein GW17_00008822 [Ensete ventricosum]|nr:hypothetical protein GW17_00008822 [Ensete ventricosum]